MSRSYANCTDERRDKPHQLRVRLRWIIAIAIAATGLALWLTTEVRAWFVLDSCLDPDGRWHAQTSCEDVAPNPD